MKVDNRIVSKPVVVSKVAGNFYDSIGNFSKPLVDYLSTTLKNSNTYGEPGKRGEIWLVFELTAVFCILLGDTGIAILPFSRQIVFMTALASTCSGVALIVSSLKYMGNGVSLLNAPATDQLQTDGPYEFLRHPMYGGIVLTSFGVSVLTNSVSRLLATVVLALILDQRASGEERLLLEKHGKVYEEYIDSKKKLLPWW